MLFKQKKISSQVQDLYNIFLTSLHPCLVELKSVDLRTDYLLYLVLLKKLGMESTMYSACDLIIIENQRQRDGSFLAPRNITNLTSCMSENFVYHAHDWVMS